MCQCHKFTVSQCHIVTVGQYNNVTMSQSHSVEVNVTMSEHLRLTPLFKIPSTAASLVNVTLPARHTPTVAPTTGLSAPRAPARGSAVPGTTPPCPASVTPSVPSTATAARTMTNSAGDPPAPSPTQNCRSFRSCSSVWTPTMWAP